MTATLIGRPLPDQAAASATAFSSTVSVKARIEPGVLDGGDELRRRQQAALGVLPAHERLGADERAGAQVVLRLEVHDELVLGQRRPQLGGQGQPVQARLVAVGAVVRERRRGCPWPGTARRRRA